MPQTGRLPVVLSPQQIKQALRRSNSLDQRDPFATDPSAEVRTLGRLALRRSDINDLFALGDLCARLTLADDQRLLVFYAGKTLIAYRRAAETADNNLDRRRAQRAGSEFVAWLIAVARANPTRRNLAVALWAIADEDSDLDADTLADLTERYRQGDQRTDDYTVAYGDTAYSDSIFQSETAATDYGDSERTPLPSDEQEFLSETRIENNPLATEHEPPAYESAYKSVVSAPTVQPDTRRAADDEFMVGDRIGGRYEIADVRRGGMGVVYLCYDHEQREPVALKSFQSRFLNNERAVARFVQEAVTWIRLEKHRYIVQARLVQNIGGRPYIILEHISGPEGLEPDLRSWIRAQPHHDAARASNSGCTSAWGCSTRPAASPAWSTATSSPPTSSSPTTASPK